MLLCFLPLSISLLIPAPRGLSHNNLKSALGIRLDCTMQFISPGYLFAPVGTGSMFLSGGGRQPLSAPPVLFLAA